MNLFICDRSETGIEPHRFFLKGQESHHAVKVLRLREGDPVFATDGKGNLFSGIAKVISKDGVKAAIIETKYIPKPEPEISIALGNIKKRDRLEFAIEKAVELGVTKLTVFRADHSEKEKVRIDRLYSSAIEAMKQSLRVWLPEIEIKESMDQVLSDNAGEYIVFVADENYDQTGSVPRQIDSSGKRLFIVGPEGGFSERERTLIDRYDLNRISLGKYRLRSETAVITIAALYGP